MRGHATLANNAEDRGVADAKQHIQNLRPDQVAAELGSGQVLLVDLREPDEPAQNGSIVGATHAPRWHARVSDLERGLELLTDRSPLFPLDPPLRQQP